MIDVREMLKNYGSPLYVFDDSAFIDNYKHLCTAFSNVYKNYRPGYSYKTNYTPHICKLVKSLGGYAEVVSDMELMVARKIGYEYKDIIYNGPCKGPMMEEHILNGGILNIDNLDEAHIIINIAQLHPNVEIKVGIRINTDIGAGFVSRFGLAVGGEEIDELVELIKNQHNLHIVGLHLHVSRARYISAWQKRIDAILDAADRYIVGVPEYIDLGSGMFADMEDCLQSQFHIHVPTYEEYANVVAGTMAKHYANTNNAPILITEPGTTVVSRYLSIYTTVKSIKTLYGRNVAILDCDIHNAGETAVMMKVPYSIYKNSSIKRFNAPVDLTGYTCLEQDILYNDFPEQVGVGDIIQFRNIGGYSVVYKPPFIQPNCAMIAIGLNNQIKIIKEKETFNDIFKTFIF